MRNKELSKEFKFHDRIISVLSLVTFFLLFGSLSSTYAWYQYSSNVKMNVNGTSIGNDETFEIGLLSDKELDLSSFSRDVIQDTNNPLLYWSLTSEFPSSFIKYYCLENGHSFDKLNGVTSGKYNSNDEFNLYRAPTYKDNYVDNYGVKEIANGVDYSTLKLAFRLTSITDDAITPITNRSIYIKDAVVDSAVGHNLEKAIRMHITTDDDENFIFNPSELNDGLDTVGGILDLDNNGLYDVITRYDGSEYEIVYGEVENDIYYEEEKIPTQEPYEVGGPSTFEAVHKQDVYAVDETKTIYSTSEYKGFDTVKDMPLCSLNSNGIAYTTFDIYLEGWSKYMINIERDTIFGLSLSFISK